MQPSAFNPVWNHMNYKRYREEGWGNVGFNSFNGHADRKVSSKELQMCAYHSESCSSTSQATCRTSNRDSECDQCSDVSSCSSSRSSSSRSSERHYPVFDAEYARQFGSECESFITVCEGPAGLTECPNGEFRSSEYQLTTGSVSSRKQQPPAPRLILYEKYLFVRELGTGTYSKVVLCTTLKTDECYALKVFRDEKTYRDACFDEMDILIALCRPAGERKEAQERSIGGRSESHRGSQRSGRGVSPNSKESRKNRSGDAVESPYSKWKLSPSCIYQGRMGRFNPPIAVICHPAHYAIVMPLLGMSLLDAIGRIRTQAGAAMKHKRPRRSGNSKSQNATKPCGGTDTNSDFSMDDRDGRQVEVIYKGLPIDLLRSVLYNILLFLRHAHQRGIVHTDLKPENVLFEYSDTFMKRMEIAKRVYKYPSSTDSDTSRESYTSDQPSARCESVAIIDVSLPAINSVRVVDVGSAEFMSRSDHVSAVDNLTPVYFHRVHTTHYRSIEVILGLGWNTTADIWSLGCMIPELLTGSCMFMPRDDMEHLALMQHIIGRFDASGGVDGNPQPMAAGTRGQSKSSDSARDFVLSRGRYFNKYFDLQTKKLLWPPPESYTPPAPTASASEKKQYEELKDDVAYIRSRPTLQEVLGHFPLLHDLCRRMLDYNPLDRITAEEALQHPFFTSAVE
ncbi:unnamed protein product [Trypanosoma congolense IL3000]|uniref:WGS project CAEQ00000000 data, annotated contig 658 n=1 Tax=Trypanosoma congolense (strain IL3000) TaxID=1068625 RepID=F9WHJ6_TRYCI|nr:unnamed protein product [Trypanosoma congolense IL3000]